CRAANGHEDALVFCLFRIACWRLDCLCGHARYLTRSTRILTHLDDQFTVAETALGDRSDNLEKASAAYEAALTVFTREVLSHEWALMQHNFGAIYRDRIRGDRADNLEKPLALRRNICGQGRLVRAPSANGMDRRCSPQYPSVERGADPSKEPGPC